MSLDPRTNRKQPTRPQPRLEFLRLVVAALDQVERTYAQSAWLHIPWFPREKMRRTEIVSPYTTHHERLGVFPVDECYHIVRRLMDGRILGRQLGRRYGTYHLPLRTRLTQCVLLTGLSGVRLFPDRMLPGASDPAWVLNRIVLTVAIKTHVQDTVRGVGDGLPK